MKKQIKVASLKTPVANIPSGTNLIVEFDHKDNWGFKMYRAWTSFNKSQDSFIGLVPANWLNI